MLHQIIVTEDGSHSLAVPELKVTYHSKHGAIRESQHIFIREGLNKLLEHGLTGISIFEMGFGTGLNALLTLQQSEQKKQKIYYETVELHPLDPSLVFSLNYTDALDARPLSEAFQQMHLSDDKTIMLSENFSFRKKIGKMEDIELTELFHLVYYDAFAPAMQPELWSPDIFRKLYNAMHPGGLLLTYCSKVIVRRAMSEAGFKVHKIAGPPGKREIVRAVRP